MDEQQKEKLIKESNMKAWKDSKVVRKTLEK